MNKINKDANKSEKKVHIGLRDILNNNKIILVISFLLAFAIWIWVSIEKSPLVEVVIQSVPVKIDMENSVPSQLNLQIFGDSEYTVDITVQGKKFIVSSLTADNFTVTAQTNYVDSAGEKSLQLKASANDSNDFEITGLSKNYISVFFDTLKETEMALKPSVVASSDDKTVIDGCLLGDVVFSKNTVIIKGPSSEVNKITSVVAETTVLEPLSATTTVIPEIKLVGVSTDRLSNIVVDSGDTAITMTLPVLKNVELPTTVTFINAPAGYLNGNISISVSPSKISAAVPVEKVNEITSLSIGTIDFSELAGGYNVFNFRAAEITDFVITNSYIKNFKATINMPSITSSVLSVPAANISIGTQKAGFTASITSVGISNVRVLGPENMLVKIRPEMLSVKLDLSSYELKEGSQNIPVHITINGDTLCWAGGTYYVTVDAVKA